MARKATTTSLFDPRQGTKAIRILDGDSDRHGIEPARTNYFGIYHIQAGAGEFWADSGQHAFFADSLIFSTPYQYIRFLPNSSLKFSVIQFHANFLCVETFHAESGCAGTLFNDPYRPPILELSSTRREVATIIQRMRREQSAQLQAFEEMLLAQLKVLLILATRLKSASTVACTADATRLRHPVLGELKELIERHYHELHAPSDFARRLHMSPKTLGRIVREQLGKSLTDLIRERILTHAKWQLLHTLKPVKEVASEVGFNDELYFSRMFKKGTGFSPTFFREFETQIRGGSNLSMLSSAAPILHSRSPVDNSGND